MVADPLETLRLVITESLRIQRGGAEPIPYIDVSNALGDMAARQNHAAFGRRGCGKTLLLYNSARKLGNDVRHVYLNCEDFKKHLFPNVLIEILDALFAELEGQLRGWFGRKKKSRDLIGSIRRELKAKKAKADSQDLEIHEAQANEHKNANKAKAGIGQIGTSASVEFGLTKIGKPRPH